MHIIMLLVSGVSTLMGGSGRWAKVSLLKVGLLKQIITHVKTYEEIHEYLENARELETSRHWVDNWTCEASFFKRAEWGGDYHLRSFVSFFPS